MTDDLEDRIARIDDESWRQLREDRMARLAPARMGDPGMPQDPVVGYSPFDIPTLIAAGVVDWSALASSLIAAPTIALGSAAAAGTAQTLIRSDATIAAFDATVPVTQAFADGAAVGAAAFAARRDHRHGMMADPVPAHAAAADPHTGYQKESEKGAASGYASLDAGTLIPTAQHGSGTADATTFLRGDRTWSAPVVTASQVSRDATAAAADYVARIRLGTDTTYRAFLGLDASDRGSLEFGPGGAAARDIAFYRVAGPPVALETDGVIRSNRSTAAATGVSVRQAGDTDDRIRLQNNALIGLGGGSASPDVNLYRSAADVLKTDDTLIVGLNLEVGAGAATTQLRINTERAWMFDQSGAGAAAKLRLKPLTAGGKNFQITSDADVPVFEVGALTAPTLGFFNTTPVTARSGWGTPTGTATRTTFGTGSVTHTELAERVKALIDDLLAYGLLKA